MGDNLQDQNAAGNGWRSVLESMDEFTATLRRETAHLTGPFSVAAAAMLDAVNDWREAIAAAAPKQAPAAPSPDVEAQARELLAAEYERDGMDWVAAEIRGQAMLSVFEQRAVRAVAAALRQQPVQSVPVTGKLVGWWNGIMPDVTERSMQAPSVCWGADAEDSGHDIPLYDGYNPIHYLTPNNAVQAAPGAVAWRWHHPEGDSGSWQDRDPAREQSWRDDEGCIIEYAYTAPNPQLVDDAMAEFMRGVYTRMSASYEGGRRILKQDMDYLLDFACKHSIILAQVPAALRPQ